MLKVTMENICDELPVSNVLKFLACVYTVMKKEDKIFIAGATGMVGSAIIRELESQGYSNIFAP